MTPYQLLAADQVYSSSRLNLVGRGLGHGFGMLALAVVALLCAGLLVVGNIMGVAVMGVAMMGVAVVGVAMVDGVLLEISITGNLLGTRFSKISGKY